MILEGFRSLSVRSCPHSLALSIHDNMMCHVNQANHSRPLSVYILPDPLLFSSITML
jgi:hypothetical protein